MPAHEEGCFEYNEDFLVRQTWIYVAEGNKNIVVSAKDAGIVLRLQKKPENKINNQTICHGNVSKKGKEFTVDQEFSYSKNIVLRLLGNDKYVLKKWLINIPLTLKQKIANTVEDFRPMHRISKGIDLTDPRATLMLNANAINDSGNNNSPICIEIKHKCSHSDLNRSPQVCRYCKLQFQKLAVGKEKRISAYCPVDFFSSNSCLVEHALYALFEEPQNNLRVFSGAVQLYPSHEPFEMMPKYMLGNIENQDARQVLIGLIIEALFQDSDSKQRGKRPKKCDGQHVSDCVGRSTKSCKAYKPKSECFTFGDSGILSKLLKLQTVNKLKLQELTNLYNDSSIENSRSEIYMDFKELLSDYKSDSWKDTIDHINDEILMHHTTNSNTIKLSKLELIQRFLISRSIQDCSLMITLLNSKGNDQSGSYITCPTTGQSFQYQIKLIDIDPKAPENIEFYYHEEQEINASYACAQNNMTQHIQ